MDTEVNEALKTWKALAETETQTQAAINAYRILYGLIESGHSPDWKMYGLTPGAFFGWGLQHVPERKFDGKNQALSVKLADMGDAGKSLAAHTEKYRKLNDSIVARPSSPPPRLRCPKCRSYGHVDLEAHIKICRPWNTSTTAERKSIEASNEAIRNPPVIPPVITVSHQNPQAQYGECVNSLGLIQARLVQAPPAHEIRALTSRARRLLDDIETVSASL